MTEQTQLDVSAHARRSDPWTSHAAARSIPYDRLRDSQKAVYVAFMTYGPMHHDLLVAKYSGARRWPRQSPSGLRTRTKELVAAGWLQDSGRVVRLPSGRRSIVWEVVPK